MNQFKTGTEQNRKLLTELGRKNVDEKLLREKLQEQDERYTESLREAHKNNQRLGYNRFLYYIY